MFHLGIVLEFLMQMCVFVLISHQHNYLLQKGNHSRCFLEFHTNFFYQEKILSRSALCNTTAAGVFYTYGRLASFLFSNGC